MITCGDHRTPQKVDSRGSSLFFLVFLYLFTHPQATTVCDPFCTPGDGFHQGLSCIVGYFAIPRSTTWRLLFALGTHRAPMKAAPAPGIRGWRAVFRSSRS